MLGPEGWQRLSHQTAAAGAEGGEMSVVGAASSSVQLVTESGADGLCSSNRFALGCHRCIPVLALNETLLRFRRSSGPLRN